MAGSGDGSNYERQDHYRRAAMFHPLRQRIARLLADGAEAGPAELSARLEQPLAGIRHHLRILVRRRALTVVPRRRPASPLYRWSDEAHWAQDMLAEEDE
jgi:DNA-binding transcriptional ArsR family regulator